MHRHHFPFHPLRKNSVGEAGQFKLNDMIKTYIEVILHVGKERVEERSGSSDDREKPLG